MEKHIYIILIILVIIIYIIHLIYNNYKYKTVNLIDKYKPKLIKFLNNNLNSNNDSNNLFIIPPVELGDNLMINGGIRYYCKKYTNVILVCKKMYYDQISYMYRDLNNILFYIIPDIYSYPYIKYYVPIDKTVIKLFKNYNITYYNLLNTTNTINNTIVHHFALRTYNALNLNLDIAYKYFKVIRDYPRENELYNKLISIIGNKYVIIIDDEKRNFRISKSYIGTITLPIFKLSNNSNNLNPELDSIKDKYIFNYIKILENASYIISIDSSIPWLIDLMNINVNTYIYNTRQGLIQYQNKNIKMLGVYFDDLVIDAFNKNNYSYKIPSEYIMSFIN